MNTPTSSIADWRKNYERGELLESHANTDPLKQFDVWLQDAVKAQCPEPNAMTLATVGSDLRPSTRIVLIKGYDERGISWFTSYGSRKGTELAGNPFAALQFHWVELERTVRIEGRVEKMSAEESDAYFNSRPLASRISAITSPQSQVVASRQWLDDRASVVAKEHGENPMRPADWGGYRLIPDRWQFWQGRRNRLHDRLAYAVDARGQWNMERLAP
ncbi:pyridoxamine 5'-phosphate oxidase [Variovorax sp. PCZ-1]|uniref:pyridoxamine 5'-phosphate oxidase n=1 Tax=Variovorax sp. PCZ-1 TaxID=2835533 RepID=UPI001BD141E3|nr:pyridoxamine 5'-phosphate oxidase [Variovorax sp. PCZ-1]MBS7808680.1 pyridoxamine 5'-phosphate oxidase [Variovorax sp. PCZ-1]